MEHCAEKLYEIDSKTPWSYGTDSWVDVNTIFGRQDILQFFSEVSHRPDRHFKRPISCLGILHICNLWILLRKIEIYLVGRRFYLRVFFAVKVEESEVIVGTPECYNIQTRRKFEKFRLFSLNSTYSIQNQVRYFQYVYNCVFSL